MKSQHHFRAERSDGAVGYFRTFDEAKSWCPGGGEIWPETFPETMPQAPAEHCGEPTIDIGDEVVCIPCEMVWQKEPRATSIPSAGVRSPR